jgi:hypothetical protein
MTSMRRKDTIAIVVSLAAGYAARVDAWMLHLELTLLS